MLKYQAVLLEQDDVTLKSTSMVNPAMFLSAQQTEGNLEHDCLQTTEEVYSGRPDLKDTPLYTDGSSFIKEGK